MESLFVRITDCVANSLWYDKKRFMGELNLAEAVKVELRSRLDR